MLVKIKVSILSVGIALGCTTIAFSQQSESSFLKKAYSFNLDSLFAFHDTLSSHSKDWQLYAENIEYLVQVVNQEKEPTFEDYLHLFHDPHPELGDEAAIVRSSLFFCVKTKKVRLLV